MLNFNFHSPTHFVFGKDTETQVGALLKDQNATKVLLHYGGGSAERSGLLDRVRKSMIDAGVRFIELGGVKPNPRVSLVRKGIDLCKEEGVDFLLAVGGGSVIDSVKGIAMGLHYDGDVWDFYTGKAIPKKTTPLATVLTIAAAGSEGSNSTVLTNDDNGMKRGGGSNLVRPVFSILNPELTYTLPRYQVASGVVDMLAHIMERYFTNTTHVDLNDRLSEALMRTIISAAPFALRNPPDYEAYANIMWASTLAHNDLVGVGRQQDWSSHALEHELSGMYDVAHGAGLAVVFPAWMKYVYKHNPARFALFAVHVFGIESRYNENMEELALKGIYAFERFLRSIDMPLTLAELGVDSKRIPELASTVKVGPDGTLGNFVKLRESDFIEIYELMK